MRHRMLTISKVTKDFKMAEQFRSIGVWIKSNDCMILSHRYCEWMDTYFIRFWMCSGVLPFSCTTPIPNLIIGCVPNLAPSVYQKQGWVHNKFLVWDIHFQKCVNSSAHVRVDWRYCWLSLSSKSVRIPQLVCLGETKNGLKTTPGLNSEWPNWPRDQSKWS